MAKKKTGTARKAKSPKPAKQRAVKQRAAKQRGGEGQLCSALGVVLLAMGALAGYLVWMDAGASGTAGQALSAMREALRGTAGMMSYIMPVMLGALGVLTMFVGRGRVQPLRALLICAGALLFCGLWHVFWAQGIAQGMLMDSYREFVRASYREGVRTCRGAGALGALTSWHLYRLLDTWGAAIVLVCALLIIAVSLSRTSMREVGQAITERISGGVDEYMQRRQVRGREKAELRAQSLERRVAREERERELRHQRALAIEQERERRLDAEQRSRDLRRRRRELADEQYEQYEQYNQHERAGGEREAPDEPLSADVPPQDVDAPSRPEAEPVAGEEALESLKSRERGDMEAYDKALRDYMAQEGVPMFLDKRVPGRMLTSSGVAPRQSAELSPEEASAAARMVFNGYDEPERARPDDAVYTSGGYALPNRVAPTVGVLDLGDASWIGAQPSRVDEMIRAGRERDEAEKAGPVRYNQDVRLSRGSAAARRIARMREEAQQAQTPAQRVDVRPTGAPEPPAQAARPEPRARRYAPAQDSAYAAGTGYDNGMPYERYGRARPEPHVGNALAGDGLGAAPAELPDELPEFEPRSSLNAARAQSAPQTPAPPAQEQYAQPQTGAPGVKFEGYAAETGAQASAPHEDEVEETAPEVAPAPAPSPVAPDAPRPDAVAPDAPRPDAVAPEAAHLQAGADLPAQAGAQRVAMYTPVKADLDKPLGEGTRLDGTPIRMPKPAMEEIPQDKPYFYPPIDLLHFSEGSGVSLQEQQELDAEKAIKLEETLHSFGIQAEVVGVSRGPAVTRFELTPAPGVRVSKIAGLSDDIALNLAATTVRIEAPIPGKSAVGIELPNEQREMVTLRDVLDSPEAARAQSKLAVALGKDNAGKLVIADIARMPHVLIAGATGSGKSVCINTIIMSIIYRSTPDEVRLILIDPKVVELSVYNGVPHLLVPVVTDPKKAASALNWAVLEMTERYQKFAERGVRDIKGFNNNLREGEKPLPQILVIIDELADLMMVAPGEVEDAICRLAQLARAAGMHLVIATQRPSVNVITGVIKANIPSRIAFTVASQVDSRTILDGAGAEKLLGRGDMLFFPQGVGKPQRVQGANVTDEEVNAVTEFIKSQNDAVYNPDILEQLEREDTSDAEKEEHKDEECDPLLTQAIETALELGQVSISMLQRRMRIGYARAGRIVDEMTRRGIIGAADGAKPRMLLISREEFRRLYGGGEDAQS